MKIESMGNVSNGVLLFPSGVSSSTVEDLFSDKVKITQQSDGTSVIELLDKEGLVKDTKSIPVVAVPVDLAQ
jgi:hypothetical protein